MSKDKSILFVVPFGAGLGHLSRETAIAQEIREQQPERELIFYTTSPANQYLYQMGFYYYYIPDRKQALHYMSYQQWEEYFYQQLILMINLHHIQILVFDGGYPFIGLMKAKALFKQIIFIWVKREGDQKKYQSFHQNEALFDELIIPGELGGRNREEADHCMVTEPIIYEGGTAGAMQLIKKKGSKLWYVQLGAGLINSIGEDLRACIQILLEDEKNEIILAESPVGRLHISDWQGNLRVHYIREYPNTRYFTKIDFAISAAGYNSYHELLYYQVPTLFIPNKRTDKDDQVERARHAQILGVGYCVEEISQLREKIGLLETNQEEMRQRLKSIAFTNGVKKAAEKIMEF